MKVRKKILRIALAVLLPVGATVGITVVSIGPAAADACYTWSGTLREGSSGAAVTQLQIRVAGWVSSGEVLVVDGAYGAKTAAAVKRFQAGYGLTADGIAGPQTFNKIYELQDNDCTPIHFSYAELTQSATCGSQASLQGGSVGVETVRENLKRTMWKLEAMRKKLGDTPLGISSGFRSSACNDIISDTGRDGPHTYGYAADVTNRLCEVARAARSAGFNRIFGPGYAGHDDHTHVDSRTGARTWRAPDCGVTS